MESLFPPFFHGTLRERYLILFGAAGGIALVSPLGRRDPGAITPH